jgi:hypothetical protein
MKVGDKVKVIKLILVDCDPHMNEVGTIVAVWSAGLVSVKFPDDSRRLYRTDELEVYDQK